MTRFVCLSIALVAIVTLLATVSAETKSASETVSLFNGKNLTGWHVDIPHRDKNPDAQASFIVRDGMLVSLGKPNGHLITDALYENYRFEVEYRFAAKPGNCGVLVHASTPRALYGMFPKSIAAQMNHTHAGDFWCIVEDITVPDLVNHGTGCTATKGQLALRAEGSEVEFRKLQLTPITKLTD